MAHDFKKEEKALYAPSKSPHIITLYRPCSLSSYAGKEIRMRKAEHMKMHWRHSMASPIHSR